MSNGNSGRISPGMLVLIVVAALCGIGAGMYWQAPIRRTLGLSDGAGVAVEDGGLWTCGMHPQVIQNEPGDCPICHMKLTPVRTGNPGAPGAETSGQIAIDPIIVQNMGVRTALVADGPLQRSIRAVGTLEEADTGIRDINLRVSGWVRKLHITAAGAHVEAGAPLFDLYSPDLQVAIDELIAARRARDSEVAGPDGSAKALYDAATKRLQLLGLDAAQVESLGKLDRAPDTVTFASPIAGSVVEKPIVEGAAVSSGERALRIVDHSLLWLDARVFEKDLPFIKVGSRASASIESRPRNTYEGEIIFIHPHVDPMTRAATARMAIRNPGLALKPGMYAIARIESQVAERAVLVPREAVIDTGESQIAMVALGGGKFESRQVKTGLSGDDGVIQVISGLSAGEAVVTSGQFLLDSESRAREAVRKFQGGTGERPPPGPRIDVTPAQRQKIDAVVAAYLAVWDALGGEQTEPTPVNTEPLIASSRAFAADSKGSAIERIASHVSRTADAMRGRTIDQQREAFKQVSQAMIALVDAAPPTPAVGKVLYLMHCPMTPAPGDWLQDNDELANPYYATDMKSCGETVRTITTEGVSGAAGGAGGNP